MLKKPRVAQVLVQRKTMLLLWPRSEREREREIFIQRRTSPGVGISRLTLHQVKLIYWLILLWLSCLVILGLLLCPIPTQTVWIERRKEGRKEDRKELPIERSEGGRKIYATLFFPVGFKVAAYKFEERYLQENWGHFRNGQGLRLYQGKCVNHNFITKLRGKRNTAHLWIRISLDYN